MQLLEDERLRAAFDVALKTFLTTFDIVLPRPEAIPFVADANLFIEIQLRTRQRYRDTIDGDFDPYKYQEKVRALIDQHITVLDLSQKIESIRITDPRFSAHVQGLANDRAKASEMEHAIRHHIRENLDEDPAYYGRLSERVDEILDRLEDRWEQIALELLNRSRTRSKLGVRTSMTLASTPPPSCRSMGSWPTGSPPPTPMPATSWCT